MIVDFFQACREFLQLLADRIVVFNTFAHVLAKSVNDIRFFNLLSAETLFFIRARLVAHELGIAFL